MESKCVVCAVYRSRDHGFIQREHWDLSDLRGGPSEKAPGWEPPPRSPIDETLSVATFAGLVGLWAWVVVAAP